MGIQNKPFSEKERPNNLYEQRGRFFISTNLSAQQSLHFDFLQKY